MKVLISDKVSKAGEEILKEAGIEVTYNIDLSYDELLEEIPKYDGIILRSMTPLNEEVLNRAKNLKVIARAGSGYDNIDVEVASKNGIIVLNTPGQNTISAAEQTMSLMLAISRNTCQANKALHEGIWDRNSYQGVELNNKTLGIIGLGRVGGNVAQQAKGFNMEVIANDPYIPTQRGKKLGVELVELEELLERSDYVTIHTPLTDETHHILSEVEFAKMKDGVRVLNVSRGKTIDSEALYDAVKSGKVAGAGLDVHEVEPLPEDYKLLELEDQVVLAPHLGGTTDEAMDNVAIDAAKQAIEVLEGRMPRTPLNIPTVRPEEMAELKPYIELGEQMGKFYAGWIGGRVEELEVIYQGQIAKNDIEPITTALLKGLLNPILNEEVNLVNAQLLAEERGIKVVESKVSDSDKYTNLIEIKAKNNGTVKELAGTVFSANNPRIVNIDGYKVDFIPTGSLLLSKHHDRPGVVGKIGNLLGDKDINIGSMQLGRKEAGGEAIMVLNIDHEIEDETIIEQIMKIEGIEYVDTFTL